MNCTTQYVENLNHMFGTRANSRRAGRTGSSKQEASDLLTRKKRVSSIA